MARHPQNGNEQYSDDEAQRRFLAAVKAGLNTKPKPLKSMTWKSVAANQRNNQGNRVSGRPMRQFLKVLSNLVVFAILLILLFNVYIWGNNGHRTNAIIGIVVLVAVMFLWRRLYSILFPQMASSQTTETTAISANRKTKFDFLTVILMCLWLVGIAIGAGLFGRNLYLSYVAAACVVLGIGIVLIKTYAGHARQ